MPAYEEVQERMRTRPRTWLATGVAGFIGMSRNQVVWFAMETRAGALPGITADGVPA